MLAQPTSWALHTQPCLVVCFSKKEMCFHPGSPSLAWGAQRLQLLFVQSEECQDGAVRAAPGSGKSTYRVAAMRPFSLHRWEVQQ